MSYVHVNIEENEYVTKSNHAFHILHCSVSPSVTKHPQVSRSVTNSILLFLHTIAIAVYRAAFGQGNGPVLLSNVECTGNESFLLSCSAGIASCSSSNDAGVVCPSCKLVQIVLTSELPSLVLAAITVVSYCEHNAVSLHLILSLN